MSTAESRYIELVEAFYGREPGSVGPVVHELVIADVRRIAATIGRPSPDQSRPPAPAAIDLLEANWYAGQDSSVTHGCYRSLRDLLAENKRLTAEVEKWREAAMGLVLNDDEA